MSTRLQLYCYVSVCILIVWYEDIPFAFIICRGYTNNIQTRYSGSITYFSEKTFW